MGEEKWPAQLKERRERIFSFSPYFIKSRGKPGHVDQSTAIEVILNSIYYEEQKIDLEIRHCFIGRSSKFPEKFVRVILLNDFRTIHNAFFDRNFRKKIGRSK